MTKENKTCAAGTSSASSTGSVSFTRANLRGALTQQYEKGVRVTESPTQNREINRVCQIIHAAGFHTNEEAFALCRSHSLLSCTDDESCRVRAMYATLQARCLMPTFWSMFKVYNQRNSGAAKPCYTLIAPHTYAIFNTKVLHDPNARELIVTDKNDFVIYKWRLNYSWNPVSESDKHDLQDLKRVINTLSRCGLKRRIEQEINGVNTSEPCTQPPSLCASTGEGLSVKIPHEQTAGSEPLGRKGY